MRKIFFSNLKTKMWKNGEKMWKNEKKLKEFEE